MPLESPVTPGIVDWTGENPGILLKNDAGGFSAMSLFFRVSWSPAGSGQLLLLYGTPDEPRGTKDAPNVLIGDNAALAEFLMENFIAKLAAFRNATPFESLEYTQASGFNSSGDPLSHRYSETIALPDLVVELVWEDLEEPRMLELTPDQTGTQEHVMFTLLVPARNGTIMVNGRPLPGQVGTRMQAGFETTTAFLYFGETWIIPEGL